MFPWAPPQWAKLLEKGKVLPWVTGIWSIQMDGRRACLFIYYPGKPNSFTDSESTYYYSFGHLVKAVHSSSCSCFPPGSWHHHLKSRSVGLPEKGPIWYEPRCQLILSNVMDMREVIKWYQNMLSHQMKFLNVIFRTIFLIQRNKQEHRQAKV